MTPSPAPLLALLAHGGKEERLVAFAPSRFRLIGTGALIAGATGLEVERMRSGPEGGNVQIAARILAEPLAAVFFFVEPMDVHRLDPDIQILLRTCNLSNVLLATSPATAYLVMRALGEAQGR